MTGIATAHEGARVLVVEDEAVTAMALEVTLRKLGYEVAGAVTTGEAAVEFARKVPIDLVLMDIRLAGAMDGVEAAAAIRREVDVPVVYLTAYSDPETLRRAKISEPYGYLVKPYQEKEVRAAIDIALHNAKIERDRKAARDALAAREKLLQDVLDNSPALIYMKDDEGRFTMANRRFEAVVGVARSELRGREDDEVLDPELRRALAPDDDRVLRGGGAQEGRVVLPGPEGPRSYVAVRFPITRPDGSPGGVCGILTDVTKLDDANGRFGDPSIE